MSLMHELSTMYNKKSALSKLFDDNEFKDRVYNKDNVLVGERLIDFVRNTEGHLVAKTAKFGIDARRGVRITGIGIVGSGKTFTSRAIAERFFKTNYYAIAFLPDVKNEYNSSNLPAPLKQPKFYAIGERPQGIPVVSVKPLFFKTFRIPVLNNEFNKPTGFRVNDLTFTDIKEIFNIDELPELQKAFVQDISFAIQKGKIKIDNISQFYTLIENSDLSSTSKASLKLKMNVFFSIDFFCEPVINPVDILNDNKIVGLNLEFFDSVDKKGGAPQIAVSIWQRQIVDARKKDILKKKRVLMIIDEANRFIPNNRETSVKLDVLENVELTRAYGVSYIFWYQTIGSVPIPILENSRYIMIPNNASTAVFKEAYKTMFSMHHVTLDRKIRQVRARMRKFDKWSWLVFDRDLGMEHIVKFYTPMSKHDTKN